MKKIAIVCDNYKLEYYKEKLKGAGFDNVHDSDFTRSCKTISIYVRAADFKDARNKIHNICQLAEIHFKQRN